MSQTVEKTFIGTSEPVSLHYSLSYYGPKFFWDNEKTTLESFNILFDKSKKALGQKVSSKATLECTAGIALPAWTTSLGVEDGQITEDKMRLTVGDDTVMGGMLVGIEFTFSLFFEYKSWIPGHPSWHDSWKPHWVSGHWDTHLNKNIDITVDLLPVCVDLLYSLAKKVPGLKKVLVIIPKGLLDHMQDTEHGFIKEDGLRLYPKMPMKWDLIYLTRQLAEVGADVIGNVVPGVGMAAITALTTVGEAMISLEEEAGLCIGAGPEVDFVFPLQVKITELIADDVVFEKLSFDDHTITATNPDGSITYPVERIGVQCSQALEPMEITFGFWSSITFAKIFSKGGSHQLNLVELLENKLDLDLGFGEYKSAMTNKIGDPGYTEEKVIDEEGKEQTIYHRSDSVEVKFI